MKKLNNDINIKIILPFLLVLITSLSLVLILISQAMFPTDDLASMNKKEAWLYFPENQPETVFSSNYVNSLPNIKTNETFIMEREMTTDHSFPTLLLIGDHQKITAYLDDELLFSNDYSPDNVMTSHPGKTLSFVTLPQYYQGKTLRIYVSSPFDSFAGFPADVYVGTANALIAYVFKHSVPNIFILLLTGLICIFTLLSIG